MSSQWKTFLFHLLERKREEWWGAIGAATRLKPDISGPAKTNKLVYNAFPPSFSTLSVSRWNMFFSPDNLFRKNYPNSVFTADEK